MDHVSSYYVSYGYVWTDGGACIGTGTPAVLFRLETNPEMVSVDSATQNRRHQLIICRT